MRIRKTRELALAMEQLEMLTPPSWRRSVAGTTNLVTGISMVMGAATDAIMGASTGVATGAGAGMGANRHD